MVFVGRESAPWEMGSFIFSSAQNKNCPLVARMICNTLCIYSTYLFYESHLRTSWTWKWTTPLPSYAPLCFRRSVAKCIELIMGILTGDWRFKGVQGGNGVTQSWRIFIEGIVRSLVLPITPVSIFTHSPHRETRRSSPATFPFPCHTSPQLASSPREGISPPATCRASLPLAHFW